MQFDWWTFALQTLNVLILIWLLQRFLFKPVAALIAERREQVEQAFGEAAGEKEKAEEARRQLEAQQRDLAARSEQVIEDTHARAREAYDELLAKGRHEAEEFLQAERERIEDERREALLDLRDRAVDLSLEVAGKLLGELDPAVVGESFLATIGRHLDGLPEAEMDELRREAAESGTVRMVTATPLDAGAETQWRKRLTKTLGKGVKVEFAVDDSLIAGAELHFRSAVLRFCWRDKLAGARKALSPQEDEATTDADARTGT